MSARGIISSFGAVIALCWPLGARAQGSGALIVTASSPSSDCRITVDGESVGSSPARVGELLPGSHLVQAICGDVTRQEIVTVRDGRSEVVRFAPLEATAAPEAPPTPANGESDPAAGSSEPFEAPAASSRVGEAYLTPPPPGWDGGNVHRQSGEEIGWGIASLVVGVPVGAAGYGLFFGEEAVGGFLLMMSLGTAVAVAGVMMLIFGLVGDDGPGPPDRSGVVFWGALSPEATGAAAIMGGVRGRF